MRLRLVCATALIASLLALSAPRSVAQQVTSQPALRRVSAEDLVKADQSRGSWLTYGRTYDGQRFSPLTQITPATVPELRPVWAASLGTLDGAEATPLMHDGRVFVTSAWSHLFVYDARTGGLLWRYMHKVPEEFGSTVCCGPNNRGVALLGDRVYLATLDDQVIAFDAASGREVWRKTFADWHDGYTSTGAPLAVGTHVILGIAGGEFGVRGFLKSYNAETGALEWTTYTTKEPDEHGRGTWKGSSWLHGGSATWITGSYDPQLNLVYWGVGNPGPWAEEPRAGDNLYSNSVIAVDPGTGKIRWHYQYTPNDPWDYDGVNTPVVADLVVGGQPVKALLQANRNGFFYVLDRTNGRFIYSLPLVDGINWTFGLDSVTGRPRINPAKVPRAGGPAIDSIIPNYAGGANWGPMSLDPSRKLAFVMVNQWGMSLKADSPKWVRGQLYTGERPTPFYMGDNVGHLKAIDLANRRIAWDWPSPLPLYGGSLTTAGGLVFAGDGKGYLRAFDSRNGSMLWKFATGSGISAPPISYEIAERQYIAVMSGIAGEMANYIEAPKGAAMLWVFGLGGSKTDDETAGGLPVRKERKPRQPPPAATASATLNTGHVAPLVASTADIARGEQLFHSMCSVCHMLGGQGPDLAASVLPDSSFVRVVMAGKHGTTMAPWRGRVAAQDAQRILAYVRSTKVAQRNP